jgi:hypothetical protein
VYFLEKPLAHRIKILAVMARTVSCENTPSRRSLIHKKTNPFAKAQFYSVDLAEKI